MEAWDLTWQDPIALGLAAAGLVASLWLHRRFGAVARCHDCAGKGSGSAAAPSGPPPPRPVDLARTRLGRRGSR